MSTSMMLERTGQGMPGWTMPGMGTSPMQGATTPMGGNWLMVPRCTWKIEKVQGGLKWTCSCEDKLAASMVQNLCNMLWGGMCCCCVMQNGQMVCCLNFTQGQCRWEPTESGFCFTCMSGDPQCGQMLQCWCDCMTIMMDAGCTCCFTINNTPVCCGVSEACKTGGRGKQPQGK